MNKKQLYYALACLCFGLLSTIHAMAQAGNTDSTFPDQSIRTAIDHYMTSMGKRTNLYNGSEYIFQSNGISGHPFFESNHLLKSEIEYDGTVYYGIPLAYDIVQDRIFTTDSSMNFNIQLYNERVTYFLMSGHHFVRVMMDSGRSSITRAGFYDLLYEGRINVYAKRTKAAERGFKNEDSMRFVSYTDYFIMENGEFIKIDSKGSLFAAFRDQKDLVKKYYRKTDLNFKKDPANAIVKTTAYYAQLKN